MVDDTGIEPVTPTMSMWCSTAEPIVRVFIAIPSPVNLHYLTFFLKSHVSVEQVMMANFAYGALLSRFRKW